MQRPSVEQLPRALHETAKAIALVLDRAGYQAWLVGGALRDLVVGDEPTEIDMATDALPTKIEELFERTTAVGKAFGTIVVRWENSGETIGVELTTFRAERDYRDGRRPEAVTYGTSVEEDAERRDFTCNALYLDPLTDDFLDPEHGLADLAARRLRAVGDPEVRFREDGLRILRLARFAVRLEFEPDEETLRAAGRSLESLGGVSPERVLVELIRMFDARRPGRGFRLLADCGALQAALPGWIELTPPGRDPASFRELRLAALEELGRPAEPSTGLAVLLDPDPLTEAGGERAEKLVLAARGQLERLHPSREIRGAVQSLWHLQETLLRYLGRTPARAELWRAFRHPSWPGARASIAAWLTAAGAPGLAELKELETERAALTDEELHPRPLLTSADLDKLGVERGARWGELLYEVESLQLEGALNSREQALRWLREKAGGE